MESFYLKNLVGTSEKYARIYRDSSSDQFEYKKLLGSGFNVIVYISNASNSPLGYTEFVNTQGVGVTLGITIDIKRILKSEIEITLENKLDGEDLWRTYQGNEPYQYATLKEVRERSYRNLLTSDIGRTESDVYSFILGSSWVATKSGNWKLKVKKDVEVDPRYNNYNICFYKGSVVFASWRETAYKLYTLIGDCENVSGNTVNEIKRIEGRYYYDTRDTLRDLITNEEVEKTKKNLVCDFLNPYCKVYDLPTFYSSSTIFKYIPEINNIYLDLDNYLKSNPLVIHAKIGQWYIFKQDSGGGIIYQAVSPTSVINMTEEDLERAIFVGDQTMILKEEGDEDHYGYYLIYNTFATELTTERARAIFMNGRLDWKNNLKFCYLDTDEDNIHFEEYFGDNGLVSNVYVYEELGRSALRKYRKNIYPQSDGIPELVGSYGGLIFYKDNSKINYL
jgi:hypothetical protein